MFVFVVLLICCSYLAHPWGVHSYNTCNSWTFDALRQSWVATQVASADLYTIAYSFRKQRIAREGLALIEIVKASLKPCKSVVWRFYL